MALLPLFAVTVSAQNWGSNPILNEFAANDVKSINEFFHRFNGEELHPGITGLDSIEARKKSVLTLFDWQGFSRKDTASALEAIHFCEEIASSGIKLSVKTNGVYAEAECLFEFKKKQYIINVILENELIRDDMYRWAIVGVNGLQQLGLADTIRDGYIDPVQNELHFPNINNIIPSVEPYLSSKTHTDQLSEFIGLAQSGALSLKGCQSVRYHVLSVKGYIFTVGLHARMDANAGWLIDNLYSVNDALKKEYENILIGKK